MNDTSATYLKEPLIVERFFGVNQVLKQNRYATGSDVTKAKDEGASLTRRAQDVSACVV